MLGKDFIEMAIKDFEDFFTTNFIVKKVYRDGVTLKISGIKEATTLIIPNDFAQMKLLDDSDKFYALLLLGHELGHYINKHNDYTELEDEETRAIEMWADFFGTIIAMSLFILGKQISNQFSFQPNADKENSLKAICGAFKRLYEIYKNSDGSNIYEHSSSRILTIVTGITSFFIRLEISKLINERKIDLNLWNDTYLELSKAWTYEFIIFGRKCKALKEAYSDRNLISKEEDIALEKRQKIVQRIHIKIIGQATEITQGIHPIMRWILGTDFNSRPDITLKAKAYISERIQKISQS